MSVRRSSIAILIFWSAVGSAYLWGACRQNERLNLSAAAGGQHPYLTYAAGIAEQGPWGFFGDRNRMPLYPAMVALVHDQDWDVFVARSAWLAIASSVVLLMVIGGVAYALLPVWPATALTLAATVCLFIDKASFVQAELAYYTLSFAAWLMLCRVIRRPNWRWAIATGVVVGLSYLTKSSAMPMLVAFAVLMLIGLAMDMVRGRRPSDQRTDNVAYSPRSALISLSLVLVIYLLVVGPYLLNNKARFGRFFYNVNSTFFIWCDGWAQAEAFAKTHRIDEAYPSVDADQIPGPLNYWQSHTLRQMAQRLRYGYGVLGRLAWNGSYLKYLVLAGALGLVAGIRRRSARGSPGAREWMVVAFCLLFFGGYSLAYSWYVPVAYGDRFALSLFLPAMFASLWLGSGERQLGGGPSIPRLRGRASDGFAMVLIALLLWDGAIAVTTKAVQPSPAFVQFYYNESCVLRSAGDMREATKGFRGVVQLDPSFAAAHHELGMIAMRSGRYEDAVTPLAEAVRLQPNDANMNNGLGSALLQAKRLDDAITAFQTATRLDPSFASAWYNLGGACVRRGSRDEAEHARSRLAALDPALARRLDELMRE